VSLDAEPKPPARSTRELEAALVREERVSQALRQVGTALGTTLDLDDLLELVLSKVTELLEADRATLYLLDEQRNDLVSRLVVGGQIRSIRIRVGHGIAGTVAQTGRPFRIKDAYTDDRFERQWDTLTGFRTTSMLAAPLKNHLGRTIGVIQVLNKCCGEEFTDEDETLLTALSTQAAVAIDNSRLFLSLIQKNKQLLDTKEQLERKLRDLELLFDLERATSRASSLEELASSVLSRVAKACDAAGAAVLLAEEETGDLVEYVLDSGHPDDPLRIGVKADEGFLSAAMQQNAPLELAQARDDPRFSERIEGSYPFGVESVLALPLEGDDVALGAIGLFTKRGGGAFTGEDLALLRMVSANVSTAVRLFRANLAREVGERLTTIGRLLSQVIHDFKTPMTVISGYVQLMADAEERDKRAEYAEEVLKQFDLLTAMQREVLEFARGERHVFIRKVFLRKFFAEITRQLGHEMDGRAIDLETNIDTKLVARFDEGRVARAIHNLARNAIEAMADRGGRLTISARMQGMDLEIRVSDTGPGVPEEIEGRLFQSFVTARKQGGTGLGLAIVKKIVDEHGGTVEVESSGMGATFTLRLPQPEARKLQRPSEAPKTARGGPVKAPPPKRTPPKGSVVKGTTAKNS
jgi:signal transduction histidine kinase/putative methionine-R-sulfoxide reductase with GAF domain